MSRDLSEFEFRVQDAGALSERERDELLGLFETNYRRANPAFLAKSLTQLRCVAPIGYPMLEFDVEPHEWELFEAVDRGRGDALLAIAWAPDAPPDW
jgi:hypothetical protein